MNSKTKPKGFNIIKLPIAIKMSTGFIKNNCIKKKNSIANPKITRKKSAFTLHIITSKITRNNSASKNSILDHMIKN
jgi:hypothetical protein